MPPQAGELGYVLGKQVVIDGAAVLGSVDPDDLVIVQVLEPGPVAGGGGGGGGLTTRDRPDLRRGGGRQLLPACPGRIEPGPPPRWHAPDLAVEDPGRQAPLHPSPTRGSLPGQDRAHDRLRTWERPGRHGRASRTWVPRFRRDPLRQNPEGGHPRRGPAWPRRGARCSPTRTATSSPGRARLQGPAPPPEADRGDAVTGVSHELRNRIGKISIDAARAAGGGAAGRSRGCSRPTAPTTSWR